MRKYFFPVVILISLIMLGVTLNVYTHLGLEDAAAEMARMEEVESARKEQEKISGKASEQENKITQRMFRVV